MYHECKQHKQCKHTDLIYWFSVSFIMTHAYHITYVSSIVLSYESLPTLLISCDRNLMHNGCLWSSISISKVSSCTHNMPVYITSTQLPVTHWLKFVFHWMADPPEMKFCAVSLDTHYLSNLTRQTNFIDLKKKTQRR
jgi:hypothetical protein